MEIMIKYFAEDDRRIEKIKQGDWIDLRASENIFLKRFESKPIPLGIAMQLPEGFEAHVVPRGSTFKNFGIIQTNSMGIIDETYCGDNDQWFMPALAMRDTQILKGDRICQFRIMEKMPEVELRVVRKLDNDNRGGYGSTGTR